MEFLQLNELILSKYDNHYQKLKVIFERTIELIDTYHPDEIAIEAPFFGKNVQVITCDTFREVVKIGGDVKLSDGAVMAIENSIAGSILPNYNLIQKSNLQVIGEVNLSISQNLLANPGVKLEDIKEVHSHPIALLQCGEFFKNYPNIKLVESGDTAETAQRIRDNKLKNIPLY